MRLPTTVTGRQILSLETTSVPGEIQYTVHFFHGGESESGESESESWVVGELGELGRTLKGKFFEE